METKVDVKKDVTPSSSPSVRQNAALTRWATARPASHEQIAEITGCGQDLAKHMAGLDLRLDQKSRHGKATILFPLYARQTGGGKLEVSAIQFLTRESAPMDFMGATETKIFKNQEAAVTVLPIIPLHGDVDGKTAKRPNNLMLVMGVKDAMVINMVTGIETVALPSSRIPHHLAERWVQEKKHQIWIHGAVEWEMQEIKPRLQDAGFAGYIKWTGNPIARIKPGEEPEISEDGKPVLNELNAEILRDDAWVTFQTGGSDAVKALLGGCITMHNPKKVDKQASPEPGAKPEPWSVEKMLNAHRKTGRRREDQTMYYASPEEAGEFLNRVLAEGGTHVTGLVATTGTGKTRAIAARMLVDTDHPYIYGAPTNDLAQETYRATIKMQERLFLEGTLKQKRSLRFHEPRSEENCQRWSVVTFLQKENRAPWAQGCQISDLADGVKGDCEHCEGCKVEGYLGGLAESKRTEIVFTVHQAISGDSSLLTFLDENGENGAHVERFIVVDEYIAMFSRLEIRVDDVLKNIQAMDKRIDLAWITRQAERLLNHEETTREQRQEMAREAHQWYDQRYRSVVNEIMAKCAEHADPKKDIKPTDVKTSGVWADFMKMYQDRPQWLDQMDGSTLGERPYLVGDRDQWFLPKLWLDALYEALKEDLGVFFYDGKLIIGKESGLFKRLLKQGGYLLDATMPQGHQAVINQFLNKSGGGGTVIDVPVTQPHLEVLQILDGNKHGRAAIGKKALPRELRKFMPAWLELVMLHGPGKVSVLTHMPVHYVLVMALAGPDALQDLFSHMGDEKSAAMEGKILRWMENRGWTYGGREWRDQLTKADIPLDPVAAREHFGLTLDDVAKLGHWGGDDRGHNRGKDDDALLIWGAPLKTPQEYQIDYHIHRAVMKKHGIELEYWDGSVEKGQTIATNGGEDEMDSSFPLPTVADARRYILSEINAQIAQGIGRLRGVWRTEENTALVAMYLGDFPVAAVEAGDYHLPTIAYQTSFQSHLCQVATKESLVVSVISAMDGGRLCLQEICDAVNRAISAMRLTIPKMGRDGARNLLNRIRAYAISRKIGIIEAAKQLADRIVEWIMAPAGVADPDEKHFYLEPERYARKISDDPDWIDAVVILAGILQPLDTDDWIDGGIRHVWPDGTVTSY